MSAFPVLDVASGWRIAPDVAPPVAARAQVVLIAALVDEITGQPPPTSPQASTTTPGLVARATSGGFAGLVSRPLTRFLPGFVTGTALEFSLTGGGFMPVSIAASLGPEAGYPDAFTPADVGTILLHRTPISLNGRTVSRTRVVRAGAIVTVDGVWPTLADLANPGPAAPNLVALASPLYVNRPVTATIAQQNLTQASATEAKLTLQPANIGDTSVRLSDQILLAVGSIIALDPQDPARAEYVAVTSITNAGLTPDLPATAVLAFPLMRPHPVGATVIRMVPSAIGAANVLSRPASVGDVTVFPGSMAGLDATMNAVVVSGGAADEYHAASLVGGTSDASGYVRLQAIHRIAQLRLRCQHPAEPTDLVRDVMLPFGSAELTLDLVFP